MDTADDPVLTTGAELALAYTRTIDARRVGPDTAAIDGLRAFDEPLPATGRDALETVRMLDAIGGPATMASTGARYFGFVNGAVEPVALASAWLASAWDQNAALPVMSPV